MRTIKKSTAILLSFIFIFLLTACGGSGDSDYMDFMKNGWDGGDSSPSTEATPTQPFIPEDVTKKEEKETKKDTSKKAEASQTAKPTQPKSKPENVTSSNEVINALDLYMSAANKVKTATNGVTCTKTKEVITEISGRIPADYQEFGFKPGTSTEKRIYDTQAKIKSGFCVEGKDYVCNLNYSDVKTASVSQSGGNQIVALFIRDDSAGTYDRSSKCVSTINIPGDKTWTCKGVVVKGTINSAGQLISLYTKVPTYVTSSSASFAFAVEQYWTITY